jgi:hypothetical protein
MRPRMRSKQTTGEALACSIDEAEGEHIKDLQYLVQGYQRVAHVVQYDLLALLFP